MASDAAVAVRAGLQPLVGLFHSLSDVTRLTILVLLAEGEQDVSSLCARLRMAQPTVSHHLGFLRMGHLVTTRREGRRIFYSLSQQVRPNDEGGFVVTRSGMEVQIAARDGVDRASESRALSD
jgi:DNA-binding transcriptional ArsR family regulator